MAEAKAEAQESSLTVARRRLMAACQAVSAERFCSLALASRLPTEHVSASSVYMSCLKAVSDSQADG